jgi:hypothetical protein
MEAKDVKAGGRSEEPEGAGAVANPDAGARCPEARCVSQPQRDREDSRCYYHAKLWDGLIERDARTKVGRPREFLDAGDGRLMQIG